MTAPIDRRPEAKQRPQSKRRPGTVWGLVVVLAFQALGAIGGGVGLIQDPLDNIGMPLSMLEGSPFTDYLIPGIILLVAVGLLPLVALGGVASGRKWGWWLSGAAGVGLLVWIAVEVIMLGYLPGMGIALQIIMGVAAVLVLTLALVRPTRRYFGVGG